MYLLRKILHRCWWLNLYIFTIAPFLLAACNEVSDESLSVNKNTNAISVVDDFSRTVSLAKPAKRIVALSPHIVENLFSAQLGDRIVAVVEFADYPEAAKTIPRVGGYANFSVESILAFQPDLVVGWGSGYADFATLVEQLDQLGIPVFVDEPKQIQDIPHSIERLAILGGTQIAAELVIANFNTALEDLKKSYGSESVGPNMGSEPHRDVQVFYQIWPDPLQTLNKSHIVSSVISLCGGQNIFADAPVLAPVINLEAVLKKNPQVIIASASDNTRPVWLDYWYSWRDISAVKNEQLYFVPGDLLSRHTLRMLDGASLLCEYIDRARKIADNAG